MTVQTIFNRMMLYDNQLDLIASGDDVTRGLTALNLVQDWWEAVAAAVADLCQTYATTGLVTVADQEYTTWPATLLRLDELWLLDSNSKPIRKLDSIDQVGGHVPSYPWPLSAVSLSGQVQTGAPVEYYTKGQGGVFLWAPTPDAVYTLRGYGLWSQTDYTAVSGAGGTWLYPDVVALTAVPFATQVMRMGLDRDLTGVQGAAEAAFTRAVKALEHQVRTRPQSRTYDETHDV